MPFRPTPGRLRRLTLLVTALCAAVLLAPAAASASRSQVTVFEAPGELLSDDAALRAGTLDEISGLGADVVRLVLYFDRVAPQPDARTPPAGFDGANPASYDWRQYDRAIQEARERGLRVLLTPSGPVPRWATRSKKNRVDRPSPKAFEQFMTAAGRQFAGAVDLWSVWNEPNHPDFLQPQFVHRRAYSPGLYRKLFYAAQRGLKASGNADDTLLIGETAPRGTPRVVAPLAFLRGALCLNSHYRKRGTCAEVRAGGYAHHPYTTRTGPWFRPAQKDDVTIGVLSRLHKALDRAYRQHAISTRDIWITEFGVQSEPDPFVGVSEARQAEYRAISERIAYDDARVRSFSQYLMRDDPPRPGSRIARFSGFESGLRHSNGALKRAYEGFRIPLVARQRGAKVTLWGLVRANDGRRTVSVEYSTRGTWQALRTDDVDARGYWSFRTDAAKGRRWRVRWTDAAGVEHVGPSTRAYDR